MRTWTPLPTKTLNVIIADTELDNPRGEHCPDDVYRLAREVEALRHLCLASIGFINGTSCLTKEAITKQLADAIRPTLKRTK